MKAPQRNSNKTEAMLIPELPRWRVYLLVPFVCAGLWMMIQTIRCFGRADVKNGFGCMAFGLMFTIGASATIVAARRYDARIRRINEIAATHPDELWKCRSDWACGEIHPSSSALTVIVWLLTVVWNAVLWPLILIPGSSSSAKLTLPIGIVGAVSGLLLAGAAVWRTATRGRLRRSVFRMDTPPAFLGGTLIGTLELSHKLPIGSDSRPG